jgi:hypothetical protein
MTFFGRRNFLVTLAAGSGLLTLSEPAGATTVRGLALSELVRASERVIVATALDSRSRFENSRSGRRIVTDVRLRVEEPWLGREPVPGELFVTIYGGKVGNQAELVFGQPEFVSGERSVLFLMERGAGRAVVTGMAQGQYRLLRSSAGTFRLTPSGRLLRIAKRDGSAVALLSGLDPAQARALVLSVPR